MKKKITQEMLHKIIIFCKIFCYIKKFLFLTHADETQNEKTATKNCDFVTLNSRNVIQKNAFVARNNFSNKSFLCAAFVQFNVTKAQFCVIILLFCLAISCLCVIK